LDSWDKRSNDLFIRGLVVEREKDEGRTLVIVRAACFLQCFNTDGLLAGRPIRPVKKPIPLILRGSLLQQVQKEDLRENRLTGSNWKKWPLNGSKYQ